MKIVLVIVSAAGLALTIFPSVLLFIGRISWKTNANLMAIGMILWFAAAPFLFRAGKSGR
jgi:hypothetical protein